MRGFRRSLTRPRRLWPALVLAASTSFAQSPPAGGPAPAAPAPAAPAGGPAAPSAPGAPAPAPPGPAGPVPPAAPTTGPTTGPTLPPGSPAVFADGGPTTGPTTGPATAPAAQISLNFKDTPVDAILDYLSEKAGLLVVKESPIDGRVTVVSKHPVTAPEAVALLGAVLKATGHAATLDGRVLRIAPRDKAKKGNIPVHVGADPAEIPATDELITQVIPLQNVEAAKLRQEIQPLLPTDADIAAHESSNTILMTDSASSIRRVVQIIAALDKREAEGTGLKLITLKNANAAAMAKELGGVFKSEGGGGGGGGMDPRMLAMMQQQGGGQPQPMPGGGGGGRGRAPGGAVDQARGGRVNFVADDRTNTLIVTAPTDTLKLIEEIITKLDGNPIPSSEMRAFPLKNAQAEPTAKLLSNLVKGDSGSGDNPFFARFGIGGDGGGGGAAKPHVNITADERTNSVIVSAPADVLKEVEKLIGQLDANTAAASEIRIFRLKNADAFLASVLIKDTFSPDDKKSDSPFRFLIFGFGPQETSKGLKVTASSDDRTNSLIVTAPSGLMPAIEKLIHQLDSDPSSEEGLFIYRLRNGQAANLEQVLNTLFGNYENGGQGQQNVDPRQLAQAQGQGFGDNGLGNGGGRGGRRNGSGGTGIGQRRTNQNGGGRSTPSGRQGGQNRAPPGLAKATTDLAGQVFVVADIDTNSLIVTTAAKYEERVHKIIEELDRPVQQVLIKVLVAEVTHDNSADFGVDFSILNHRGPNGENGQSGSTDFGNALAGKAIPGGLVVQLLETNVNATLHALAQEGKLDVLSRPYILASDNQLAAITVGSEVPFIVNSILTDNGQTINTVQYQDVGIILNVTPHVNPDGLVILDVNPEISQVTADSVPIGNNATAPIIAKRSADSRVGIKNGQTIVIGGLMEDRKTSTVSKVPVLGDLPILGPAFSRIQVSKTKTELLIFLTPHVAAVPEALPGMSDDERRGTKLTPGAVGPGVFGEHMQGMGRGANGSATTLPAGPVVEPDSRIPLGTDDLLRLGPPPPATRPEDSATTIVPGR